MLALIIQGVPKPRRNRPLRPRPGLGVRVRHSRVCLITGAKQGRESELPCSCEPTYEAFYYDAAQSRKVRKSFPTMAQAIRWRRDQVRGYYGLDRAEKKGRVDVGYEHLRKAAQQLDAALPDVSARCRPFLRDSLTALHQAEDHLLYALVEVGL